MDTYGHLFPDADEATSTALDDLFGPAQDIQRDITSDDVVQGLASDA